MKQLASARRLAGGRRCFDLPEQRLDLLMLVLQHLEDGGHGRPRLEQFGGHELREAAYLRSPGLR
ncbi:MAG TPA: hypothetical protein VFQ53_15620 [Kofleriaceae bacterium]|nr:hypothetical protein [Kofleriaceae bacterium]